MKQDIEILKAGSTGDIFKDAQNIIEQTRNYAYQAVNVAMVQRNWLLGKRIADEELQGENRAEYGKEIIKRLADYLTNLYGKGFTKSNLYQFVQFYKFFPEIFHAVSGKSQILSWTHYRNLLRVTDKNARDWYLNESINEVWSARTLDRNIASQYYYRLLQSQHKQVVKDEMEQIYTILKENSFLNQEFSFNIKYELADFLIERATKDNINLSLHKNMFAYDCPIPTEPKLSEKSDGTFSKATIQDLDEFIDLWDWFHTELQIAMKTREEYCKDAENSLKNENVYLWKNQNGKIVACCRYIINENLASIGLVYTNPDYRRKHYAQNLVYQVTKIVAEKGFTPMLYTDADYIASNSCYEKIGYILQGKLCTVK